MATLVEHTRDHRGMLTSRCPECRMLWAYWDDEDLDEDGNLWCFCTDDDHIG